MNIIRKIKLESLGYYTCKDDAEKDLFQFIHDNLLNLKEVELKEYSNYKFWFKDDKCIYDLDIDNNEYHFSTYIVNLFKYKFNIDIRNILNKSIGKVFLEGSYNYMIIEEIVNKI